MITKCIQYMLQVTAEKDEILKIKKDPQVQHQADDQKILSLSRIIPPGYLQGYKNNPAPLQR